jgi:hypothetical protein
VAYIINIINNLKGIRAAYKELKKQKEFSSG